MRQHPHGSHGSHGHPSWRRHRLQLTGLAAITLTLLGPPVEQVAHASDPLPLPAAQPSFTDQFSAFNSDLWARADGWTNGSPFACGWRSDHLQFDGNRMSILLDNTPSSGAPYASGATHTTGYYGYGCYEASFQPVPASGVVSSFFSFAGPFDNGGNSLHNEIDIEFLGYDTHQVQANFWTNDDLYASRHERIIPLGFDASSGLHTYGFKWTSTGIEWWVDRALVYQVESSTLDPVPKASESLQRIFTNVWPVDSSASGWAGTFVYASALHAAYDWVRFTAGEGCSMTQPSPASVPVGDPSVMHVSTITMALVGQSQQAVALVAVVNGSGQAVSGATVNGIWSGLVTGGDTRRTTDSYGATAFYSVLSSNPGTFTFCITSITKNGMTYAAGANTETCDGITK